MTECHNRFVGHSFSGMIVTEAGVHPNIGACLRGSARADAGEDTRPAKTYPTSRAGWNRFRRATKDALSEEDVCAISRDLPEGHGEGALCGQETFIRPFSPARRTTPAWGSKPSDYAVRPKTAHSSRPCACHGQTDGARRYRAEGQPSSLISPARPNSPGDLEAAGQKT